MYKYVYLQIGGMVANFKEERKPWHEKRPT